MRIRLLGTAAGGGLPQWNCNCSQCIRARSGALPHRSQSCIAVAAAEMPWVVINASPDFACQMDSLNDPADSAGVPAERTSPFGCVLITNTDLDHVLGLASLRECPGMAIYCTGAARLTLEQAFPISRILDTFGCAFWRELDDGDFAPLTDAAGCGLGLDVRAIFLGSDAPRYARDMGLDRTGQSIALVIQETATGRQLLAAPDVGTVDTRLRTAMESADAVLFDGTFWSADELACIRPGSRTSAEMGHIPVRESLDLMSHLPARWKSYIHINNTNPVLDPDSPERAAVDTAGIGVDEDGTEWLI
jgi:pyrroloquinoline quinone biosynthesis protein B